MLPPRQMKGLYPAQPLLAGTAARDAYDTSRFSGSQWTTVRWR